MIAIISIMVLIAGISLYDYFSSRTWQQVTSSERNDLVFAERNREYGAYQLRQGYNLRVLIIMGVMVFGIGSAYAIYRVVNGLAEQTVKAAPEDLTQFSMDAPKIEEPLDPPPAAEIPPMERTIQFLPPVVNDDAVDDEIPPQDEMKDVEASTTTNDTDNEGFGTNVIVEKPKEVVVEKKEEIFTYVDEPAEFPGGMAAMRKYLGENINYPQTAKELGLEGKCYLQFVVSANGNISNVEVKRGVPDCPECDKEAVRVVKGMPHWKPGKNGGKAVHSTFNLPVSFTLQ